MVHSDILGWLSVTAAVLCFGSFGVPIKSKEVRDANIHPFVFQTYKSFWVFVTSWLVLTWQPMRFTPWGIVSGLFWVPAGAAYVYGVEHAGLAINQALSSSCIVAVSTIWGFVAFHETVSSVPLACLAFILLAGGISTMAYYSVPGEPVDDDFQRLNSTTTVPWKNDDVEDSPGLTSDQTEPLRESSHRSSRTLSKDVKDETHSKSFVLGLCASAFNGLWGGSVLVPLKLSGSGTTSGIDYVFSFGIGVSIVTVLMWVCFIVYLKYNQKPIPSLSFKVMWRPGSIAGILWSLGNFFSIYAVLFLGEAVGYSSCQAAILVSGVWGLLYFHEAPKGKLYWCLGALACTGGIILLSQLN